MWVNAMVRIRPNRRARRGARSWEQPPRRPAAKNTTPVWPADRSKRRWSQSTRSDVTTNPLPAESRLNRPASSRTVRRDDAQHARRSGRRRHRVQVVGLPVQAAVDAEDDDGRGRRRGGTTPRWVDVTFQSIACGDAPRAPPTRARRTLPRRSRRGCRPRRGADGAGASTWPVTRACSVGRKTLTSPADGLSVPTTATANSGQNQVSWRSRARSRASSRVATSRSVRSVKRWLVSPNASVSTAEPISVPVTIAPTSTGEKPSPMRYCASSTLTKPSAKPADRPSDDDPVDVARGGGWERRRIAPSDSQVSRRTVPVPGTGRVRSRAMQGDERERRPAGRVRGVRGSARPHVRRVRGVVAAAADAAVPTRRTSSSSSCDDLGFSDLSCYGSEIADAEPRRARGVGRAVDELPRDADVLADAGRAAHRASTRTAPAPATSPTPIRASPATPPSWPTTCRRWRRSSATRATRRWRSASGTSPRTPTCRTRARSGRGRCSAASTATTAFLDAFTNLHQPHRLVEDNHTRRGRRVPRRLLPHRRPDRPGARHDRPGEGVEPGDAVPLLPRRGRGARAAALQGRATSSATAAATTPGGTRSARPATQRQLELGVIPPGTAAPAAQQRGR